jgi:hypothetical protein
MKIMTIYRTQLFYRYIRGLVYMLFLDDDDVYLDKLQTRGIKKSILYM